MFGDKNNGKEKQSDTQFLYEDWEFPLSEVNKLMSYCVKFFNTPGIRLKYGGWKNPNLLMVRVSGNRAAVGWVKKSGLVNGSQGWAAGVIRETCPNGVRNPFSCPPGLESVINLSSSYKNDDVFKIMAEYHWDRFTPIVKLSYSNGGITSAWIADEQVWDTPPVINRRHMWNFKPGVIAPSLNSFTED